jgi:hypothetical protein
MVFLAFFVLDGRSFGRVDDVGYARINQSFFGCFENFQDFILGLSEKSFPQTFSKLSRFS